MTVETPPTEVGTDGTYPVEILDSFYVAPGHCFRMFRSGDRRAAHCAEPVVWRGPWRDVTGEEWTVEACERHLPDHVRSDALWMDPLA